jgi:Leucine-rich repeat (LRR) protein
VRAVLLALSLYWLYLSTGSTIPSEIGLLTQLMFLSFSDNSLTSTIPSEIGLLTKLKRLTFSFNQLTSTIPNEIGLLTQLTVLSFRSNWLEGTIPSSLCSLPSLVSSIWIDCGEITCDSGCCREGWGSPCV